MPSLEIELDLLLQFLLMYIFLKASEIVQQSQCHFVLCNSWHAQLFQNFSAKYEFCFLKDDQEK